MAEPAQQPPQPRRDHALLSVVGDDLFSRIDARAAQLFHERVGIGQRMAAAGSGLRRGEILVEVQEARAWDMRLFVFRAPAGGIGEIVPAVEHRPVGVGKLPREDVGADERGEDHVLILSRTASFRTIPLARKLRPPAKTWRSVDAPAGCSDNP